MVDIAQHSYDQQLSAIQDLNKAQATQTAKLQEQERLSGIDSTIGKLLSTGVSDPKAILDTLTTNGVKATSKEVADAISNLSPDMKPIYDAMTAAAKGGAPSDILQKIGQAKSVPDAISAAGRYLQDSSLPGGTLGEYLNYKKEAVAAGHVPMDWMSYKNWDDNNKLSIAKAGATKADLDTAQSLAEQLVHGFLAPSELSKRTTGSVSYNTVLKAADDYSMLTTGKHFDIAKSDRNYKFANTPNTQNTLNYLGSLVGSADEKGNLNGGNLGDLKTLSNQITRTNFPALNDAAGWVRYSAGDPKIAQFQATATEVADQVAKILQGGGTGSGTSDAKLQQAVNLFNTGFSKKQLAGVIDALIPLLKNRAQSMVKDNPYLSDYAVQFGFSQNGVGADHPLVSQEDNARQALVTFHDASPANAKKMEALSKIAPNATAAEIAQKLGIKL